METIREAELVVFASGEFLTKSFPVSLVEKGVPKDFYKFAEDYASCAYGDYAGEYICDYLIYPLVSSLRVFLIKHGVEVI